VAYDEELADRIRALIAREPGLSEKKMFARGATFARSLPAKR